MKRLLDYAVFSTPFYKDFQKSQSFQDFPVINKKMIQDRFELFKSDGFKTDTLFKVSTSGSTGVPFKLYHNKNKRHRNTADVLFFSEKSGYSIGDLLFELEVWRGHNKRRKIKNLLQNTVQFDISKLTNSRIECFLNLLEKSPQPKSILGFPSALEQICKYIDANKVKVEIKNLNGVIANSEYLNDYTRDAVKSLLGAPIYSRYSSEELGIIAHQTRSSGKHFEINWASYFVEILDMEKDVAAKEGTYGRLVITDLFNKSMPLIRYDTGDIAMFQEGNNCLLKTVDGRKMDMVYDTSGNLLSSYVVYTKFYPFYDLLNQYQFIQVGQKEYHIKLNLKGQFSFEEELVESVKRDFGVDAKVSIELVDEIPPLSSGKRKKVVNIYNLS
ncbi:CoF synthetase [Flagellimonas aurea]|uniref:CoF synthetase n=1 Tax=Flagellimonas aurea TaxID=2915619 RepID=UPI0035D0083B